MKIYNYLLFRIYRFYTDVMKEKEIPLVYVTTVSTLFIGFNLYTISSYLVFKDIIHEVISSKSRVIVFMVIVLCLNYILFIKGKRFLNYNFKKDFKGGLMIAIYMLLTATSLIWVINLNRAKIFEQRRREPLKEHTPRRPSLEGKIREWFKNH
ncbi:hypothetical protein [Sphingobacterium siyangense]|uniref:hypothetical protein n=1 Tax=Sphingobacterium siyangense TaxID=459529 RepID=UPI00289DB99C|nr:hypothetical protein [Sphingobacterium siyangense]